MSQQQRQVHPSIELPSESAVRSELARVLASDVFSRSDRVSAFLSFIVEQTLAGQGHTLKEQVLASELYGKGADFSGAVDPIVRVDARRLRDKLREYYAFATRDPVVISVPKGSYIPIFQANEPVAAPTVEEVLTSSSPGTQGVTLALPQRWSRLWVAVATLVLLGVTWLVIGIVRNVRSEPPTLRLFTVTAFPGWEGQPSISPDGNFVAFARAGPGAPWITKRERDAPLHCHRSRTAATAR
jgi:hypothetical protein